MNIQAKTLALTQARMDQWVEIKLELPGGLMLISTTKMITFLRITLLHHFKVIEPAQ